MLGPGEGRRCTCCHAHPLVLYSIWAGTWRHGAVCVVRPCSQTARAQGAHMRSERGPMHPYGTGKTIDCQVQLDAHKISHCGNCKACSCDRYAHGCPLLRMSRRDTWYPAVRLLNLGSLLALRRSVPCHSLCSPVRRSSTPPLLGGTPDDLSVEELQQLELHDEINFDDGALRWPMPFPKGGCRRQRQRSKTGLSAACISLRRGGGTPS